METSLIPARLANSGKRVADAHNFADRNQLVGVSSFASLVCLVLAVGTQFLALFRGEACGALNVEALGLCLAALPMTAVTFWFGTRGAERNAALVVEARKAQYRTDELFALTDMLQSADTYADATAVVTASSLRLLPGFGAALYVFNNSRDRLDLMGSWNMPESYTPLETLAPANCWALKRGRPHISDPGEGTLCCAHHSGEAGALEVPMMARGQVYGLMVFVSDAKGSFAGLRGITRLARALADSMSLALSNIALREKLRTQSLRDPLTGLYNRRYMEDALERYVSLAERNATPTSVMMIDLDNFKLLNDTHGHAKGDAVLRDVASQLVGGLRPSDVICRYGGEELVVILPNCSLDDAATKAEILRGRIASLTEVHGADVSASFGLATIPETSATAGNLIALADTALYRAKGAGKNRVICAERRRDDAARDGVPRLSAAG